MEEFDADRYVRATAPAIGLALTPCERAPVAAQMKRIHALAQLVLDFELAPTDEAAPRFEP